MSQKHFDSVWVQGSKNFAIFFNEPIFYSMMSPFYVAINQEINSLGLPGMAGTEQGAATIYNFTLKNIRIIHSKAAEYLNNPIVQAAMLPYFVSAYGTYEYSGNASTASKTELAVKDYTFKNYGVLPNELAFRLAMLYGFYNYALEPVKSEIRQFLLDTPDATPDFMDRFMSDVAVPYAKWVQAAGVVAVFATAAVVVGTAAGASSAATAAGAGSNAAAGTTLAEVSITMGAESAAATAATSSAAAATSTSLSSIGSFVSAEAAAGIATAGAALEAAAKKEVQNAIVGALTPDADAASGAPASTGQSAVPKVVEAKNAEPLALGALGLLLLLFI